MTELFSVESARLLPLNIQSDIRVQAFCYALDRAFKRLKPYMDGIVIWPYIRGIDDTLADYLAVELRTPFYDQTLPIETKRDMIGRTLTWYSTLGTANTVNEIVKAIFDYGQVEEWHEYGGQPYHFQVRSSNPLATPEDADRFRAILNGVKNVRSWLDDILILRTWGDVYDQNLNWGEVLGINTWGDIFNNYATWGDVFEAFSNWGKVYGVNTWGSVYSYVWEESR